MNSFFSKTSVLFVGIAIAGVAYFLAKPAHNGAEAAKPEAAPTTVAATQATAPDAKMPEPDAKIFFAIGKATLPADGSKTLESVIAKLKANPAAKATISGFNDATGDKAKNELLSKERAKSVREALRAAGVAGEADARIVMQKPDETMGSVDAEQARRVDVTVQ